MTLGEFVGVPMLMFGIVFLVLTLYSICEKRELAFEFGWFGFAGIGAVVCAVVRFSS